MLKLVMLCICVQLGACSIIAQAAGDPMLEALHRVGKARAAVCVRGGVACPATLWSRHWVLTRASCLAAAPSPDLPAHVLMFHGPAACHNNTAEARGIPVRATFIHPDYEGSDEYESCTSHKYDGAMLLLAYPANVPPVDNHTKAVAYVPNLQTWLHYVPAQFPFSWDYPPQVERRLDLTKLRLTSTPARLFATTVLLPLAALLLLFALALRLPNAHGEYDSPSYEHFVPDLSLLFDVKEGPPLTERYYAE